MTTRARQHARQTTRRIPLRYLVYLAALLSVGALALAAFGLRSVEFVVTELVVLAAMLAIDRFGMPVLDRWDRGATGEEEIGGLLAGLGEGLFRSTTSTPVAATSTMSSSVRPVCLRSRRRAIADAYALTGSTGGCLARRTRSGGGLST
jgi:hypothetical protein